MTTYLHFLQLLKITNKNFITTNVKMKTRTGFSLKDIGFENNKNIIKINKLHYFF